MDRLACALGGKTMLPHILTNVNNMLSNCNIILNFAILENKKKLIKLVFLKIK